jgi:GT2 family glycosyltransferase
MKYSYKASIIIPNWNGIKFVEVCLTSVFASDFKNFEVIVVDNGSQDGSREKVEELFEYAKSKTHFSTHLVKLPSNMGFARACNEGMYNASGEYIVLLNNDVEVEARWLKELVTGMERHPECGMGTSKMVQYDNRKQIYNTGDLFRVWCTGGGRGFGEIDSGQYESEVYVVGACAGAGIYRRSLFDQIGYFDEDFFIFSEDVDINLRAQYAGYRCVYLPKAIVYHWGTATVGFNSDRHVFLGVRNDLFVLFKNYSVSEFFQWFQKIYRFQLSRLKVLSLEGQGWPVLKSFISFLFLFPRMVPKRIKQMSMRKRSLGDLEEIIKE